jgi:hypothetical protein
VPAGAKVKQAEALTQSVELGVAAKAMERGHKVCIPSSPLPDLGAPTIYSPIFGIGLAIWHMQRPKVAFTSAPLLVCSTSPKFSSSKHGA